MGKYLVQSAQRSSLGNFNHFAVLCYIWLFYIICTAVLIINHTVPEIWLAPVYHDQLKTFIRLVYKSYCLIRQNVHKFLKSLIGLTSALKP